MSKKIIKNNEVCASLTGQMRVHSKRVLLIGLAFVVKEKEERLPISILYTGDAAILRDWYWAMELWDLLAWESVLRTVAALT